eukprot:1156154-Rhodomonas_salina.1
MATRAPRRQPRARPYRRVTGTCASVAGPFEVYLVPEARAAAWGLDDGPHVMHLLLQRPTVWSRARHARAMRRRNGAADVDTIWEDDSGEPDDDPGELLPSEGEILHLRGTEHRATTTILAAQPFPSGRRPDTALVTCRHVGGLPFPVARW